MHSPLINSLFWFSSFYSFFCVSVNVAGKSQQLEPSGADVLGINIPFGEFLNAGSFETTVLDESIRVSRSKVGPVEQIRVFVKVDDQKVDASVVEDEEEDVDDDELAVDDDDDDELADDTTVDAVIVVESDDEENNSAADDDDDSDGVKAPSDIENWSWLKKKMLYVSLYRIIERSW